MTILVCQGHSAAPSSGAMVCLLFAFPPLDADVSAGRSQTIHVLSALYPLCLAHARPTLCITYIYLLNELMKGK